MRHFPDLTRPARVALLLAATILVACAARLEPAAPAVTLATSLSAQKTELVMRSALAGQGWEISLRGSGVWLLSLAKTGDQVEARLSAEQLTLVPLMPTVTAEQNGRFDLLVQSIRFELLAVG